MKIALCVSSMSTGGAERVASILADTWSEMGNEVFLITTFSRATENEFNLGDRVVAWSLAEFLEGRPRLLRSWPFRVLALAALFRRLRPDIVCSLLTNVNVTAIIAAAIARIPIVVSERTFPPMHFMGQFFERARRMLYPRADRVVMQTDEGLQWLLATIPNARGAVIPNPVKLPLTHAEPEIAPERVVAVHRKVLLSVGRCSPEKRFGLLIEAFARCADRHPQWDLVIIGDGQQLPDLRQQVARLGLNGRITLPGRAGNPQDWYDRADAFALTSAFEGYPNSLLEALANELPALAIACPTGPGELLPEGNGILLEREAGVEELCEGVDRLLTLGWPATASGARALRSNHAPSTIAAQWIALFQNVIDSHASKQG